MILLQFGNVAPEIGIRMQVERNAFGRQYGSFIEPLCLHLPSIPGYESGSEGNKPLDAVFIRAPVVKSCEPGVEVIAALRDGRIVGVKEHNMLGTAFHPELTPDTRLLEYFLQMCFNQKHESKKA